MGVIFRKIADTIKYLIVQFITGISEEEGEFIGVGVVEGGGPMGPVAGGVGILFLVARMVACNIIVLVLCVTTRRSHRHLYGQGVERRSYIDSPHRLLQVVSTIFNHRRPTNFCFDGGLALHAPLLIRLYRCQGHCQCRCRYRCLFRWRMCGARATPLSVAVYVIIQMPVPMPHSMEGQKVQSWLIFCYLSAVHTDRTTVRE